MRNPGDETIILSRGEDRLLDCILSNGTYPPPISVYWKYNGSYIATGTSLQLRDADQNQTGVYECTTFSGYGSPASKRFYVVVDDIGRTKTPTTWPTDCFLQAQDFTDDVCSERRGIAVSASAWLSILSICCLWYFVQSSRALITS